MRLLITAGPTREFFDTVRFISNASSGKMGYAIAAAAAARGHEVTLVSGPVALDPPPSVEFHGVTTAQDMLEACLSAFDRSDAAIMTAAVSDWRPAQRRDHKAPKDAHHLTVSLEPTPDIAATLGARKGRRVVVAFAVEDREGRAHAESKMLRKHCDAIALNGPQVMGDDYTTIEVKVAGEPWTDPLTGPKQQVAQVLVDLVERLTLRGR